MADRGLKNLADFGPVSASDAHLTDLDVDCDVALSNQDQAFYALLFLFEHVLKRDFGKINAIRSTKAARIPTVMSKSEVMRVLWLLSGVYLFKTWTFSAFGKMRVDFGPSPFGRTFEDNVEDNRSTLFAGPSNSTYCL